MAHRDTTRTRGGRQPARQQVPSLPDATAPGLISSRSALEFCQELYLSPILSKNNLDQLITEIPSPTPSKKSHKVFQVSIYLCKAAASRLFSSTFLFSPGSGIRRNAFPLQPVREFSVFDVPCPPAWGAGHLGLKACPESLRRGDKPSFSRWLPSTYQVSCCAPR